MHLECQMIECKPWVPKASLPRFLPSSWKPEIIEKNERRVVHLWFKLVKDGLVYLMLLLAFSNEKQYKKQINKVLNIQRETKKVIVIENMYKHTII